MPRLPSVRPNLLQIHRISQRRTLLRVRLPTRRFHSEPQSHSTHRALHRWTAQAIGTPFLVAYVCERVANSDGSGGMSWKLDVDSMGEKLLVEPARL